MTNSATSFFYNFDSLYSELASCWSEIAKEADFKIDNPKKEIQRGFKAYTAARKVTLPFVILGGAQLREDIPLIQNCGTLAIQPEYSQLEICKFLEFVNPMNQPSLKKLAFTHLHHGSIINDSNWWIFLNDMFMLGALHEEKEFLLSSQDGKIPHNDLLWDKITNRPRVLGRELLMLHFHEYKCVKSAKLGYGFIQSWGSSDIKLTLRECRDRLKVIKSVEEIKCLFLT